MRKCEKRNMAGHFFSRKKLDLLHWIQWHCYSSCLHRRSAGILRARLRAHYLPFSFPLFPLSSLSLSLFPLLLCPSHHLVFWSFHYLVDVSPSDPPLPTRLSPSPLPFPPLADATCASALGTKPRSLSPSVVHTNSSLSHSVANKIEEMVENRFHLWR